MPDSDDTRSTEANAEAVRRLEESLKSFLDSQERDLDAEISRAIGLAESAFNRGSPDVNTHAEVDRVIGLLKFLGSHAQRLKNAGRPDVHARVTAVLADLTAARNTLAQTMRMLVAANSSDAANFAKEQDKWLKQQKELIEKRLAQGQTQANEVRKLL